MAVPLLRFCAPERLANASVVDVLRGENRLTHRSLTFVKAEITPVCMVLLLRKRRSRHMPSSLKDPVCGMAVSPEGLLAIAHDCILCRGLELG